MKRLLTLRPADWLLVSLLLAISFLPWLVGFEKNTVAVLKVDGQIKKKFPLTPQQHYTYRYRAPDGDTNVIEIKDQKIRIKQASCPDQRCVQQGWIEHPAETLICLPHKLSVTITGGDQVDH